MARTPPAASVVVPFRADQEGLRRRNLDVVLRWLTDLPVTVVVAEQDWTSSVTGSLPPGVRHVHVQRHGPFAKAAACNAGFSAADSSVVAFVDADILLRPGPFVACLDRCAEGVGAIRPFGWLVELDAEQSRAVAETGELPAVPPAPASDVRGSEFIPFCGGAFIIRREAYEAAGGMDESFIGWGGEDDALSITLARLGLDRRVLRNQPACHLWHARPQRPQEHPFYLANIERVRRSLASSGSLPARQARDPDPDEEARR
jgi:glycosyltransferase involved in cell wall biosynthesis